MCRTSIQLSIRPQPPSRHHRRFAKNTSIMVTGYRNTSRSTHIEQVASRLNWPCVRVNLDSHISRIDLVGKDSIVVRDRHASYRIPRWHSALGLAAQHRAGVRRIYDAGRPDVMFVIQRRAGRFSAGLTLLDQNKVIKPHPAFRLFSPPRTRWGSGDTSGLTTAPSRSTRARLDRWSIVTHAELSARRRGSRDRAGQGRITTPHLEGRDIVNKMVRLADLLTANAFANGDLSTFGNESAHRDHLG